MNLCRSLSLSAGQDNVNKVLVCGNGFLIKVDKRVGVKRNIWVRYKQNKDVTVKVGCIYTHNALKRVDQNAALGCHYVRIAIGSIFWWTDSRIRKK